MLNQAPNPAPGTGPDTNSRASLERLDVLFRHVLQTAQGRHLWQLVVQHRKEPMQ